MPEVLADCSRREWPQLFSFFEDYLTCYENFDPKQLGSFFAYPCLICDSTGDHFLADETDIAGYGAPFLQALREAALRTIEFKLLPGTCSTYGGVFCSTRSKLSAEDGTLIGDMEYHYHLVNEGQRLRIKYASMGRIHHWI